MNPTRRSLLQGGAGLLATGALAGCLDDLGLADREFEAGYAAFFTLWDWADRVSGDAIDFEDPVGTGTSGHGWNPPGDLTRDVADAGIFVYLDTPEFAWAQDVATTLEADYDDVVVVDGFEGLDDRLLDWDHEREDDGHDDHDHNDDHDGHEDEHDHDDGHEHEDDHDHDDDHDEHSHDGDHDHDRSSVDPHAWLDPVLAQDIVDTIAAGLEEAQPDEAETFTDNAAAYKEELAAIDEQFEELIDDASHDTAVLAGHDSFTYLEARYGFELHTPIGVSPQEEPSHEDVSETIALVDEEGIDTILYDAFDAPEDEYPPLVETILEDSDATDAMPLTPASGTLAAWQEEGWGYREQMEEINVPALREALDAQ